MHELSIALEILRAARVELEARAGGRLETVTVAIGDLAGVEPRLLTYAWESVTAGSDHEGARLNIDWVPAKQNCSACGEVAERQPGTWLRLCPQCDRPLRVEGGRELELTGLSFDQPFVPEEVLS